MSSVSSVTSYTNFPSVSQSAPSLTPIIPSTTASLDSTYRPPVASATRFLITPRPSNDGNGVDMKLALGLGIGLGLSALLAALVSFPHSRNQPSHWGAPLIVVQDSNRELTVPLRNVGSILYTPSTTSRASFFREKDGATLWASSQGYR